MRTQCSSLFISRHSPAESTYSLGNVHNLQVRLVSQIVDFCPEERYAPSNLNETKSFSTVHSAAAGRLSVLRKGIQQDDLLRLVEIGSVAVDIDTTGKISRSDTMS